MAYTSKYTGEEIDAKLDEVKPVEVVDSLDSEDTTAALSANQGRRLKEMIDNIPSGGNGGGTSVGNSANEPIVLYFAMDSNFSEQQKQSNATNVALLIDAISQGKYGNNFLIGLVVSGSVMTLAQPFFYTAFNGMLKVGTSFSAVKESTQFYWVAQRLSFGTDGNVTIE